MAKAKKQEAVGEPVAADTVETKKRAPRKAPAAKAKAAAVTEEAKPTASVAAPAVEAKVEAKSPAKPAAPAAPLIDTSLAARAAASFVGNRSLLGDVGKTAAPKAESAAFKQLKQGANRPAANLGALFGVGGDDKKSNRHFGAGGPNFRTQTQSGFNKTGVPRRTGGG